MPNLSVVVFSLLTLFVTASGPVSAQSTQVHRTAETTASVPALPEFHSTIFKLWHTAWPNKDTEMMRALLPDLEKGVAKIDTATLPGILRDRQSKWRDGVKKLDDIMAGYRAAAAGTDNQKLLDAAEKLHAQYEQLVRVIRPVMKEVDEFHAVLYSLYHYYMPQDSVAQMKSSAVQLKEAMAKLNAAALPERWKERKEKFEAARSKLSASVDAFATVAAKDDVKAMKKGANKVHTDYQALERVFE